MLVGNLDQPTGRVRADSPQRATVWSMEQTPGQSGRDPSNRSHVLNAERAGCHQVAQLGPKWPRINPVIANLTLFGERRHSYVLSPKPSTWRRPRERAGC